MSFICFGCFLLCSKPELFEHGLWDKDDRNTIDSNRNWQTSCFTDWNSQPKIKYKDSGVFGCLRFDPYFYWWKPNTQPTSWCLGWSLVMVTLCLSSTSHVPSDQIRRPTSSVRLSWSCAKSKGWLIEGLYVWPHKQENPILVVRWFCDYINPNTWLPNSRECNPHNNLMLGAVERDTKKTPFSSRVTVGKNNSNIYLLKQEGLREITKLSGSCD